MTFNPALDRLRAAIADQRRQADEWRKPSALITLEAVRALDDLFCRELFEERRRAPTDDEAFRTILTWGGNQALQRVLPTVLETQPHRFLASSPNSAEKVDNFLFECAALQLGERYAAWLRDGLVEGRVRIFPKPDEPGNLEIIELTSVQGRAHDEEIGRNGLRWASARTVATLRELGQRGDIIKRMHRALSGQGIERGAADYVLAGEADMTPVVGRLVARGLDDELHGTAYAVVDGIDGRTHHVRLADLDAAGDSAPGSIVELRAFEDAKGERRVALAVRSDLSVEAQTTASGATWLDRQLVARDPGELGGGFGLEVKQAMEARAAHLIEEGLARREGQRVVFARNLLATLRQRELDALGQRLAAESAMSFQKAAEGDYVAGTYSRRFALASGRFAMIDDGLGFKLVPWTPSIEKHIGQHISGVARADGVVDWSFGRKRGLGL